MSRPRAVELVPEQRSPGSRLHLNVSMHCESRVDISAGSLLSARARPLDDMTQPDPAQVLDALLAADRAAVEERIESWARAHGYMSAYATLLEPALVELGRRWESGEEFVLAQGYLGAKITEGLLGRIAAERQTAGERQQPGAVVLGNIEDDFHSLGRRMVGTFLRLDGWNVHDLGNDVLPATFVDKALEVGARVIGASAMMYTTATNIAGLREEIDRRVPAGAVKLAVGGAVFALRPELVHEVGGDGTARNALAAAALFRRLHDAAAAHGVQA